MPTGQLLRGSFERLATVVAQTHNFEVAAPRFWPTEDWKAPIGSDPNAAGSDGRTALHRACFQGHHVRGPRWYGLDW